MQNARRAEWSLALLLLVFAGLAAYAVHRYTSSSVVTVTPSSTSTIPIVQSPEAIAAGTVTLKLGELARFTKVSIRPTYISEESRCAQGNTCIQAGTVKVAVEVTTNNLTETTIIGLNQSFLTPTSKITLLAADPYPVAGKEVSPSDYRLTFNVSRRPIVVPAPKPNPPATTTPIAKCFVGGCSGQICSDQEGMVSTCEYRADYACYKTAKCERQTNGQCGWTSTPELTMCLANPPALQ